MSNKNKPYLPKMRTNYHPTDEECKKFTVTDTPEDIPNPATDPIVVNNIASQEFDYTQDMLSDEDFGLNSKNTDKF